MESSRLNVNMEVNNLNIPQKINNLDKVNNSNKTENTTSSQSSKQDNGYDERIDKLLNQVNEKFKVFNRELKYDIHEKTNRYIVTVKDSETGDVIKEIPSEESLDLFAKMLEMAGIIVDEKS